MSKPRYTSHGDFVSDSGLLLCCVVRGTMAERTQEAAEIAAKLEAHDKLMAALSDYLATTKRSTRDYEAAITACHINATVVLEAARKAKVA